MEFALDSQTQKILELSCDKEGVAGHPQINYAIDLIQDGFIYIMDDDNTFHPNFWKLLPTLDPFFVYTWDQNRIQENRILKGGQIKAGQIDTSQFIVPRHLINNIRWSDYRLYGDYRFISKIYKKHKDHFKYIPEIACYHNFIKKVKVALCFFGLTRSLKFTMPSIEKCIFEPLKNHGIKYNVFLHTYKVKDAYNNPRAEESNIKLDSNEYKMLKPDFYLLEDKDEVSKKLQLEKYRTHGDPWVNEKQAIPGDFTSIDNHILYLWSQKQLMNMVSNSKSKYTHIVLCRPDVLYQVPMKPSWFNFTDKIYIPNFGLCGNITDRFALGGPEQMIPYGNRFDDALEYSKKKRLASEEYLIATMRKHKIKYEHVNFYFIRVRANGIKDKMDIKQIRGLTRSNRKPLKGTRKIYNTK